MTDIDRLKALSAHLRTGKLGHAEFDFGCFNNVVTDEGDTIQPPPGKCGTNGCAIGELPTLYPKEWRFNRVGLPVLRNGAGVGLGVFEMAAKFFGISTIAAQHLFSPGDQLPESFGGRRLNENATKEAVADNIDEFILTIGEGGA